MLVNRHALHSREVCKPESVSHLANVPYLPFYSHVGVFMIFTILEIVIVYGHTVMVVLPS